jgi:hypothetical protein
MRSGRECTHSDCIREPRGPVTVGWRLTNFDCSDSAPDRATRLSRPSGERVVMDGALAHHVGLVR